MLPVIENIYKNNPNKIAYIINSENITYKNLWEKANNYAELLKREGTSPVIIYGHKSTNMIISIIACLMANRAYVPIDVCTPLKRIKRIIKLTKSTLIIKNEKINIQQINCCELKELTKFKRKAIQNNTNQIAYIIFTSGSTGEPKGVPISKNNLNNFIHWISNLSPLKDYQNINVLNQASFSFDLSIADIFYTLCNGHTLIALDKDAQNDYNKMFKIIKDNKINVAIMTPSFIKLCLLNKDFNEENYPFFKCFYFCGETLEINTVNKMYNAFPNIKIINAYGPTEATSAISAYLVEKETYQNYDILPVGDINNLATSVNIINDEIVLKGASVFDGYLGNNRKININYYKTGDIGYIKNDKLFCKGRIDNQIKYKGYRIELDDIENNIRKINGVINCAVIAKKENNIVKYIKAFVILEKDYNEDYIRVALAENVPNYMIPRIIKKIDKLPLNSNQKIDRKRLNEL